MCIQGVSNQFRRGVSRCHVYSFIIIGKTIRAPPIPFFSPAVGFLATGRLPAARLAVRCGGGRSTEGSYKSPLITSILMQNFMLILVMVFFLYSYCILLGRYNVGHIFTTNGLVTSSLVAWLCGHFDRSISSCLKYHVTMLSCQRHEHMHPTKESLLMIIEMI